MPLSQTTTPKAVNWKRGSLRFWVVASVAWLLFAGYSLYERSSSDREFARNLVSEDTAKGIAEVLPQFCAREAQAVPPGYDPDALESLQARQRVLTAMTELSATKPFPD